MDERKFRPPRFELRSEGPSEEDWAQSVRRYLKSELALHEVTYRELADRLSRLGFKETEASIANKLARGTFQAGFFLAVLEALGIRHMTITRAEPPGLPYAPPPRKL